MPVYGLPGVPPEPIPLTILTGFLGSGKTTVLNRLLKDPAMAQTLVIVNEFGEIGLDHQLIETIDSDLVLLSSGCLCCTIRGDLISTLESLLRRLDNKRMPRFNRIVIETTGLADPAPILHTVMGILIFNCATGSKASSRSSTPSTGFRRWSIIRKQQSRPPWPTGSSSRKPISSTGRHSMR